MLKNHVGIRRNSLDTVLVVVFDIAHRSIWIGSAKSVAEVHTETVHFVLGQPISKGAGEHGLGRNEIVVPVLIYIVRVRSIDVEPRVAAQVSTPRIEFVHWVETRSVVKDHIQDDRNAAFVALINKFLKLIRITIDLIQRKEVVR